MVPPVAVRELYHLHPSSGSLQLQKTAYKERGVSPSCLLPLKGKGARSSFQMPARFTPWHSEVAVAMVNKPQLPPGPSEAKCSCTERLAICSFSV